MGDRRLRNLQAMTEIWTPRVNTAKAALDEQRGFSSGLRGRLRGEFRQAGLCLAAAKEQIEYLTGSSNARRDEAFAQYTEAMSRLRALEGDREENRAAIDEQEAAECAADLALLQWCAA